MKKLLFLLIPACFFAQTNFKKLDSLQFRHTVDQLVKDTGRNYVIATDRNDDDSDNLMYINSEDKSDILYIKYDAYMDGKNIDLEIVGEKKWGINAIYGKYLALFPLWKKFVDPQAEPELLSKKGYKILNGFSITKYDNEGHWRISF